ncbi:MAG: hypothetical protein AAFN77_22035 [Planctomycetota bacterium]
MQFRFWKYVKITATTLIVCLLGMFTLTHDVSAQGSLTQAAQTKPRTLEFRIDSKLFVAGDDRPQSHNVTLFSDGIVYDFQSGPNPEQESTEIVIYNSRTKETVLLDQARQMRLDLHDIQILKMLDGLRKDVSNDKRTEFLVNDRYEEIVDVDQRTVTLEGEHITYRVKGIDPFDEKAMPMYHEFLAAFTRLHATDPTKLPPFPRLRLNQSIRRVAWMPIRVEIRVEANSFFKTPFSAHTTHQVIEQLSDADRQRITDAKVHWLNYKPVTFSEYRGLKDPSKLESLLRTARVKDDSSNNQKPNLRR